LLTSFVAFFTETLHQNGVIRGQKLVTRIGRPWGPFSHEWDCRLRQTISRDPSRCENCFKFVIDIVF